MGANPWALEMGLMSINKKNDGQHCREIFYTVALGYQCKAGLNSHFNSLSRKE